MMRRSTLLAALFFCSTSSGHGKAHDTNLCDPNHSEHVPSQVAVLCYTSHFLVKMLSELDAGNNKTVQHVRVHLMPYLGGEAALEALEGDSPDDAACKVCYSDPTGAKGLKELRSALPVAQLDAYDAVRVCHGLLTERVLSALPQSPDGVWLVGDESRDAPAAVRELFGRLFASRGYTEGSCRRPGGGGGGGKRGRPAPGMLDRLLTWAGSG